MEVARKLRGFGWDRWSKDWPYGAKLTRLESAARPIGRINLEVKLTGKRSAGKPHAAFDEAGDGNQDMVGLVRHSQKKTAKLLLIFPAIIPTKLLV